MATTLSRRTFAHLLGFTELGYQTGTHAPGLRLDQVSHTFYKEVIARNGLA